MKQFCKEDLFWINEPKKYSIEDSEITIETEPVTDFWQRTYYNFQNDNAPGLLMKTSEQYFSFVVKTQFNSEHRFDQCGVLIYQDSENWLKGSIEYQDENYSKLGSVVTNKGYSDWATTDISSDERVMYYRLSRRGYDFCLENSTDGKNYKQMRITHLFSAEKEIQIGIYACSPEKSSFEAKFSEISLGDCKWETHK